MIATNCPTCGFRAVPASGCPVCFPPAPRQQEAQPVEDNSDGLIDQSVNRLLAAIDRRGEQTLARLAALPKSRPCGFCDHPAYLDENSLWDDVGAPQEAIYVCPACHERDKEARLQKRVERAGIPADVRAATLDNFQVTRPKVDARHQTPAQFLVAARAFDRGEIRNLILAGGVGIGKGHLAAALCIAAMRLGRRIAWAECARLFRDFHRAYEGSNTDSVIDPLIRADILVLDEVCLRALPSDGEEILFSILDPRHKAKRRTILLGNQPGPEVRAWLGERIRDRLISGGLKFCFGSWESMRGKEEGF